jgi:hypothetical protein
MMAIRSFARRIIGDSSRLTPETGFGVLSTAHVYSEYSLKNGANDRTTAPAAVILESILVC